jgi:putative salt-induced outer membrane protein YdiY
VVGTQTTTAPLSGVSAVRNDAEQHNYERLQHPRFSELWIGNVDFGLALARGNSRTDTLTTAATAARVTSTDKLSVYFNQIHGTARVNDLTSLIASAVRGGWKYNRSVSKRAFLTGFDDYEHDRFQNLNFRLVAGLGAGMKALKTERAQMDVDAGVDYLRENFMDGLHRNSSEGNFGDAFVLKLSNVASLTQAARAFVNMQDRGAYRLNFDLQENTVLKKWLGWNVTASDRFLSNPVQGRQRNDLILSTGFRLTFAR